MELERIATEAMIDAIRCGDKPLFLLALDSGADVDANDGEPLLLAAELKRFSFIKELFLREAGISAALGTAKKIEDQQDFLWRKARSSSLEERQAKELRDKYQDIARYLANCLEDLSRLTGLRQLRALENIASELKELRLAAAEMLEPRNLRKAPSLSLPKIKP